MDYWAGLNLVRVGKDLGLGDRSPGEGAVYSRQSPFMQFGGRAGVL